MIENFVLIIGAMKSGTTTLFAQLAADPRIAPARIKEPGFFAFEEVRAMDWDWYEGLFGFEAAKHRYALEGSTDYTKAPFATGVTERLAAAEAEGRRFKLIYVMRHPVERLTSHARHVQIHKREVGRSLSPRKDHGLDAGLSPVNLAASDYATQLEPYRRYHERGDLYMLTTERMNREGPQVMEELSRFLELPGLAWREDRARRNDGASKSADHPVINQLGPAREAVKALLPKEARRSLRERMRVKVEAEGRFAFTSEERQELMERFAGQAERLRREFGFDPGWDFGVRHEDKKAG